MIDRKEDLNDGNICNDFSIAGKTDSHCVVCEQQCLYKVYTKLQKSSSNLVLIEYRGSYSINFQYS